jgi:Pectate lyase superfamily protein
MAVTKAEVENALNLKWFGAKWDGVTDDTKALESAMEASVEGGGTPILLPPGTGVMNSIPAVPKNLSVQIPIRGAGMRDTTVKLPEALQFLRFANTKPGDTVGNVDLADFTVDGNEQPTTESRSIPVIVGTSSSASEQVNVVNVRCRRLRTIKVPALDAEENARRNIYIGVFHKEPGLSLNVIEHIDIRECEFLGGQYGVFIEAHKGGEPLPLNVHISDVYIGDCRHLIAAVPTASEGYNGNFQVGQYAWSDGNSIVLERLYGENSGDVGIEVDVPCTVRDCTIVNANQTAYLLNTFNCAVTKEPVVTKVAEAAAGGAVTVKVVSSAAFAVGQQLAFFGSKVSSSEVRMIKAIPDAEHVELTEGLSTERGAGVWVQQVDDMGAARWVLRNVKAVRTASMPGSNHGLTIQNIENVLPAPKVDVDGYAYVRSASDILVGEVLAATCGNASSPTGNPRSVRIKNLSAEIQNLEYGGTELKTFWPMSLQMRGPLCPVEIQGEITIEGPGATGSGKIGGQILRLKESAAVLDVDLTTKWAPRSTGGEGWRAITLNIEKGLGDLSGRIRHRALPSSGTGTGAPTGVRLGKGAGFASQATRTTLRTAVTAGATVLPVVSTEGFAVGMPIVLDAGANEKSEILVVSAVEAGPQLAVVPVATSFGVKENRSAGAVVAALRTIVLRDCDWSGFGTNGVGVALEDEAVAMRLLTNGITYPPTQPKPVKLTIPASTKIFQIQQKGQSGNLSVQGGTVSLVEWSPDGKNFITMAAATGVSFHVSTGDFIRLTWTAEPTVNFGPDRN